MKFDDFLRFNSVEKLGRIKMTFEIAKSGLTFWLDRTNEIPEWEIDYITGKEIEFESELKQLFESEIVVEYKGSKTIMILLDKSGTEVWRSIYVEGLGINWFSKTTKKTFRPYFEM